MIECQMADVPLDASSGMRRPVGTIAGLKKQASISMYAGQKGITSLGFSSSLLTGIGPRDARRCCSCDMCARGSMLSARQSWWPSI